MGKTEILEALQSHYNLPKDVDFANKLGISSQVLHNWKKRNTYDAKLIYTNCLEINPEWLLTGNGEMLKGVAPPVVVLKDAIAEDHLIPLYDGIMTASMISQTLSPQTEPVEMVNAGDWFRDATAAMRVHGDSMFPTYDSGTIVAMREVINKMLVVPGQDYMIETSEYRVIKRLQKSKIIGCYLACSTNDDVWEKGQLKGELIHEPFEICIDDIMRLYQILGCVRRNSSSRVVSLL